MLAALGLKIQLSIVSAILIFLGCSQIGFLNENGSSHRQVVIDDALLFVKLFLAWWTK